MGERKTKLLSEEDHCCVGNLICAFLLRAHRGNPGALSLPAAGAAARAGAKSERVAATLINSAASLPFAVKKKIYIYIMATIRRRSEFTQWIMLIRPFNYVEINYFLKNTILTDGIVISIEAATSFCRDRRD